MTILQERIGRHISNFLKEEVWEERSYTYDLDKDWKFEISYNISKGWKDWFQKEYLVRVLTDFNNDIKENGVRGITLRKPIENDMVATSLGTIEISIYEVCQGCEACEPEKNEKPLAYFGTDSDSYCSGNDDWITPESPMGFHSKIAGNKNLVNTEHGVIILTDEQLEEWDLGFVDDLDEYQIGYLHGGEDGYQVWKG